MPIPPPPVEARPPRRRGGAVGAALLVLAVVFGLGHVLLSGTGDHSYDRNPTPPSTVRLTVGATYLISTVDGPGAIQAVAPLTCTSTATDGATTPLTVTAETADSRATHAVAKFVAPATAVVTIACTGGAVGDRAVFVDDADDAGADLAGWLLLLCVVCALVGVGLVMGAIYRRSGAQRVSGVTDEPTP